jgi:hypothetical protein
MTQVAKRGGRSRRSEGGLSEKAARSLVKDGPIRLPGKLERWPIGQLVPYENNPRTHSDEQVVSIVRIMKDTGWTNPILVDEKGVILAGHGRLLAAKMLALPTVPVIQFKHLSEAQKRAYRLADNKTALLSGWDNEALTLELQALEGMDFDLELTGFDLDQIASYLGGEETEEAVAPEPADDSSTGRTCPICGRYWREGYRDPKLRAEGAR